MRTSLVMPTLNGGPLLDQVLDGIDQQPGAAALERIAVDSGSDDGTVQRLRARGFTVHSIDKRDFNHGTTRDLAISMTRGDVIVLLTQDAVPADREWLPRLVACYQDSGVGAAYCKQLPRDNCNPLIKHRLLQWTAGQNDRVEQQVPGATDAERLRNFEELEPMTRLQTSAYDNVAGSVRRTTWENLPFGYRRFGEDVAFGKRLVLSGQKIVFEPRSAVVHSHNRSPEAEGKRIFCDHENLRDLFDIHLMTTYDHYRNAARGGREEFRRILSEIEMTPEERAHWTAWSDRYAQWSALGIFLGGNAPRFQAGPSRPWFERAEAYLRRGI